MPRKSCLRCDWEGETKEPTCPDCGTRPLYVIGLVPPMETATPVADDPQESSRGAPGTARPPPGGPEHRRSDPEPAPTAAAGSAGRSTRSAAALGLLALALTVALGTWLNGHAEGSTPTAPAAPTDAAELGFPFDAPTPAPDPLIGRRELTVGGIAFSYRVSASGWEPFDDISTNKSTVGPQDAEAIIFWTSYPAGDIADPCTRVLGPSIGPTVADLATAASTAPGTRLLAGPVNVTLGGRPAKHLVLAVRKDVGCDPGFFFAWSDRKTGAFWPHTWPGYVIRVWIVAVRGTRLFIAAETTDRSDPLLDHEIYQIVGSIRLD